MITQNQRLVTNLSSKINKIFKIVPLYEEKEIGLITVKDVVVNVESLIFEFNGFSKRMNFENVAEFEAMMDILTAIKDEVSKEGIQPIIKRESFKCIDIMHCIIKRIENGDKS